MLFTLILSPGGGEGTRSRFMAPMRVQDETTHRVGLSMSRWIGARTARLRVHRGVRQTRGRAVRAPLAQGSRQNASPNYAHFETKLGISSEKEDRKRIFRTGRLALCVLCVRLVRPYCKDYCCARRNGRYQARER